MAIISSVRCEVTLRSEKYELKDSVVWTQFLVVGGLPGGSIIGGFASILFVG
jgi:hypothetical protein